MKKIYCLVALALGIGIAARYALAAPERKRPPSSGQSARAASGAKSPARAASGSKSSARAASSAKPSARAASGGKSARAASMGGGRARAAAGSKRASSLGNRRAAAGSRRAAIMGAESMGGRRDNAVIEEVALNPCPLGKAVQRIYDDSAEAKYFKAKDKDCNIPSNSEVHEWNSNLKDTIALPAWIQKEEAVYFNCIGGYVQGKVSGEVACINTFTFCPIGEVLARTKAEKKAEATATRTRGAAEPAAAEAVPATRTRGATPVEEKKAETVLKNPKTDAICVMPPLTKLRNVAGSSVAVMLDCPAGSYSDVIPNAGEEHLKCTSCPDGKTSLKGSFALTDCYKVCEAGQTIDPNNADACVACSENSTYDEGSKSCICNKGYSGTGSGAGTCQACPPGKYCPGGRAIESCDGEQNQYSDTAAAGECKVCPWNAASDGTTCYCAATGKTFDAATNTCR